jgi:nucleotide-binding universal stress UspA family protein
MNTILCATDLSETADRATEAAAALARALGVKLEVLHVVEIPAGLGGESMLAYTGAIRQEAEQELVGRLHKLARYEVPIKGRVELGRAREVIVSFVETHTPGLLVLGTHDRSRFGRALFGSVAEHCLQNASCPVMIVPQGSSSWLDEWKRQQRPLQVTAGIDFSPASEAALQWLRQLREQIPSDVDLVHLYWPIRESRRLGLPLVGDEDEGHGEISRVIERELRARVGTLPGSGDVRVRARAMWSDEMNPLVWEAETDGADLIVVGTSQRGASSTALGVLRSAKTPVVCVPARAEKAPVEPARRPLRHVAVFTDLSELGNSAVPEAVWLLRGAGLLTICHVSPAEAPGAGPEDRVGIERQLHALAALASGSAGLRVKTLVHESTDPAHGIVQAIRRIGPDLVVLTSHGRSGVSRAILGSVAEQVVRHAPTPVVVIPPPAHRNPAA